MSYVGIYTSNFLKKYTNRVKNFECFNCKLVSPKNFFIECQHCICQKCLHKKKFCSLCPNQKIETKGENPTAFQFLLTEIIINPYYMYCIFPPCGWQGSYQDFISTHYYDCEYRKHDELKKEYFIDFNKDKVNEKNRRSKSEIKLLTKNVKNKYLLNNKEKYNNDVIEIKDNEYDEEYNKYTKRRKDGRKYNISNLINKNKMNRPYKDDFEIVHSNHIFIRNGLLKDYSYVDILNSEKGEKFLELNSEEEEIVNLSDDKDDSNENEIELEEDEENEEEENEEEEDDIKIEIGKDKEEEEGNYIEVEQYYELIDKDTSKWTNEKENEVEEIESDEEEEDNKDEEEEIEDIDEYEESEEEEKKNKKNKKRSYNKYKRKKSKSYNYNFLNKK